MESLLKKSRMMFYIFLAIFFTLMCLATIVFHAWATQSPRITLQKPVLLSCIAILMFLVFLGLHKAVLKLPRRLNRKFICTALIGYVAVQLAFIGLFPLNVNEDAAIVVQLAKQILDGNFSSFEAGHYLGNYPNNIGITMFFALLFSFLPKSYFTIRLCNVIFTTITAWLIYKLYKELMPEDEKNAHGALLLALLFPPAIILNNLTYGDVVSTTLNLAAMLFAIRFANTGKLSFAIYTSILLMTGNFVRGVTLLFFLAIMLYWFIKGIMERKVSWKKTGAGMLLTIVMFNLPLHAFSIIGLNAGIIQEPVGTYGNPVWRWINIGFPNSERLGYWDNGRNITVFVYTFKCNREKATKFFIDDIVSRYKEAGLKKLIAGYIKKTFWLWSEGTYSVNFYGLAQGMGNNSFAAYYTPVVKYLGQGDTPLRVSLTWFLHSFNWLVMILAVLYIKSALMRKDYRLELFIYVIFAYIVFYILWEVKTRYLFGLYPILIIMAYNAIGLVYKDLVRVLSQVLYRLQK